ncbi:hypothetical protein AYI68_g7762, partial [Smittium mucronatum]
MGLIEFSDEIKPRAASN